MKAVMVSLAHHKSASKTRLGIALSNLAGGLELDDI